LLIEDEPEVRRICALTLRRFGYDVLIADDEQHALEICASQELLPQAVLVDVVMPRISGVELADRLRGLLPGLRVLFMSGYSDRGAVEASKMTASVSFIHKPFTPDALAKQLRTLLDGSRDRA
jgi:CheY-like chemotaxis protein